MAGNNPIDVGGVGLDFALKAMQRNKKSGVLSAEVRGLRIWRRCYAFVELQGGEVIACYATTKGQRPFTLAVAVLIALDAHKGPFNWTFSAQEGGNTRPDIPIIPRG